MKPLPRPPPFELEQLARLFCQDFDLLFPGLDVVEAARTHLDRLPPVRSAALRRELEAFLTLHAEMPSGVLGFWGDFGRNSAPSTGPVAPIPDRRFRRLSAFWTLENRASIVEHRKIR